MAELQFERILSIKSMFGVASNVRNNVIFASDSTVVYPAGKTLVFQELNGPQTFINGSEKTNHFTAMCMSPNRKYILVAEKTKEGPIITYFDIATRKRKKVLQFPDLGSEEYISLSFSEDGKLFAALGGAPEYKIVLWVNDSKTKLVGGFSVATPQKDPIYNISISPDNKVMCVIGNGVFKLLRFEEGGLKNISTGLGRQEHEKYLHHCWIEQRLIISNDHGELFLFENCEFKCILSSSPSDGCSINVIAPYSKGFICGGENGIVSIFEHTPEDKEIYKRHKTMKIESPMDDETLESEDNTIINFTISPNHETLVLSTSTGQIYTLNLTSSDLMKEEDIRFEYLSVPFHSQKITGVDTCVRKPIIATCSFDRTVRIWNYLDSSVMIIKQFNEEAHSLSLHPTGLFLVVGFSNKLRFLNILGNDVREVKSFLVRNCNEVKFSNGGQYFAAVNGTIINIYSTYTLQYLKSLKGHNGKIRCICWSLDDTKIASVGMDGAVIEFEVSSEKKINENVNKSCQYTGSICDGKAIFACSQDKSLREFQESQLHSEYHLGDVAMLCLALATYHRTLIGGMEDGSVRIYSLSSLEEMDEQIFPHSMAVNRVCLTFEENYILTISDDASLCIIEMKDKEGRRKGDIKFSEEILISSQDLEEKNNVISELKAKVQELKNENDYAQKQKEFEFNDKLNEQASNFKMEIKLKNEMLSKLKNEKQKSISEYEKKLDDVKRDMTAKISTLDHDYNQRIAASMEQIEMLKQEKLDEKKNLLDRIQRMEEEHQKEIQDWKDTHEEKMQFEIQKLQSEKKEHDRHNREAAETLKQTEEDRDKEIEDLKLEYEGKITELKGRNVALESKIQVSEEEKKELKELIEEKEKRVKEQSAEILKLKQKDEANQKEIRSLILEKKEREDTIVDKEKRIFELKKQNQELEKFKFVLDYKINTLQAKLKPNKEKIATYRKELKKMDKELENSENNNNKLKLQIKDLELKIDANNNEIFKLNNRVKDIMTYNTRIKSDIHECVQLIQEPKQMKDALITIYQKYVTKSIKTNEIDYDIQREYDRQRNYLEKTVESLKKKLQKGSETAKVENMRIMNENVVLINEINQLRREVRTLRSRLRDKEEKLKNINYVPGNGQSGNIEGSELTLEEAKREIEMQKLEIQALREKIEDMEDNKRFSHSGSISREKLPPMEGFD